MSNTDSSYPDRHARRQSAGPELGLFFNEEEGQLEKFRPYAWPVADWLAWVRTQLQRRSQLAEPAATPEKV